MENLNLIEIPIHFIRENLNGWVILVLVAIIIYFVMLRTYYIKREQFYDNIQIEKNAKETGGETGEESSNDNSKKRNSNEILEGFESPTNTNYAMVGTNSNSDNSSNSSNSNNSINTPDDNSFPTIFTTLFDNIKLNPEQIISCKTNYINVIKKYIIELLKLVKLKKTNEYLNTKKQFDMIIAKGIDDIMNNLANNIKSQIILTRSSIKLDVNNALSKTLEALIDKINSNLSKQMNSLAMMNSTTINYKTMLLGINNSRTQIENYVEIEKLITNNGSNLTNYNNEINNTLAKSFILPIYERNFDRINQLINSDFNNNENNLATKYGQAYTDFLNEKKKDELDVNPLRLASKIESSVVNLLSNLSSSKKKSGGGGGSGNNKNSGNSGNKYSNNNSNDIIEQYNHNPIPEQNVKLSENSNLNNGANIYNDRGNLGTYLIDKKTQKQVLESFKSIEGFDSNSSNTTDPTSTKYEYKKKNKNNNKDLVSNLLSGDFIQYIMDTISEKLSSFYKMYDTKYGNGNGNGKTDENESKFNIEENMIPMGFLFFILSMLFYFIDTTS